MRRISLLVALLAIAVAVSGAQSAVAAVPTMTGFAPASGPPGWSVTVTGTGFAAATAVTLTPTDPNYLPKALTFTVENDTTIVATVPFFATEPLDAILTVATPDGPATTASDFAVDGQVALSEHKGSSGEPITLAGFGFTGATRVVFGTWRWPVQNDESFSLVRPVNAHFRVLSDSRIATTIPTLRAGGHYWVKVVSPASTSVSKYSSPFSVMTPRLLTDTYGRFAIRPVTVATEAALGVYGIGHIAGQGGHRIHWRVWSASRAHGTGTAWCPYGTTLRGYPGSIGAYRVREGRFTRITLRWNKNGHTHRQTLRLDGMGGPSDTGYWWQP